MARYLIQSSSPAKREKVVQVLQRSSTGNDIYISHFGYMVIADVKESDQERVAALGTLYPDEQLSPFAKIADPHYWKKASLNDVLNQISAPPAWKHSTGDEVTIAILDSGVDGSMPEFPVYKRKGGICFCHRNGAWHDEVGHGTMAACVAAGTSALTDRYSGVAPHAKIFSCRSNYSLLDVQKLLDSLYKKLTSREIEAPLVINCSYGWKRCDAPSLLITHPMILLVKELVSMGVVMVCAAGNNHDPEVCPDFDPSADTPGSIWGINSLDEVICVGAVDWNDQNTTGIHSHSSRGPGQFAKLSPKPDCVAPCYGFVLWGNQYLGLHWWGTSGASPLVAGLAGLVQSRTKGALQPAEVKEVILQGCRNVGNAPMRLGCGVIDCLATMKCL
jgi:serine protease AprX